MSELSDRLRIALYAGEMGDVLRSYCTHTLCTEGHVDSVANEALGNVLNALADSLQYAVEEAPFDDTYYKLADFAEALPKIADEIEAGR